MSQSRPLRVTMIGPAPRHWGGGGRWPGGGIASHIAGLLPALPGQDVALRLLADNVPAGRAAHPPDLPAGVELEPVAPSSRSIGPLFSRRAVALTLRSLGRPEIRRAIPLPYLLRFVAQGIVYDRSLARHPAELLHVHQAFQRQFLCQQVLEVRTPLLVTVHSVNALLEPGPAWMASLYRSNFCRAGHMIAVSSYVKERVVSFGADPDRVAIIANGVNVDLFSPGPGAAARQKLGLPADAPLLLFSGNLIPRKGVDVLLQALARLAGTAPDARLVILGGGPEEQKLVRLAGELGVSARVEFRGARPFAEMPLWYRACDVYVMPSWAEGLSMAVLEAMSSGRPVVTTRPDQGQHDAVQDSQTGRLTHYGDVEELARSLESLLSDAELRRVMGANARQLALESFDWRIVGRLTAEFYRSVIEHHHAPSPALDR